jgi:hypothetical protein
MASGDLGVGARQQLSFDLVQAGRSFDFGGKWRERLGKQSLAGLVLLALLSMQLQGGQSAEEQSDQH